ncbi:MAG: hypothetical protein HY657_05900 [Acidobacteria bacterium]|nr:hypothetical protein [Acidobacteriota bacterium]
MRSLRAQPLRRQLFVFILLLLVPVFAAAVWAGLATYRERVADLRNQTEVTALTTAAYLGREVTGLNRLVENIGNARVLEALNPDERRQVLRRLLAQRPGVVLNVALRSGRQGDVVRADQSVGAVPREDDWRAVFTTGKRVISSMQSDPSSALRYVVIAYPVIDEDRSIVAAIGFLVSLQALQNTFASLPLPQGSVVSISDREGRILSRNLDPDRYIGRVGYVIPPSPQPRSEERTSLDGVRRTYVDVPIEGTPWTLTVGVPIAAALDRTMAWSTRSFTVFGLGLVGWLVVALVLSQRLGQSVSHLDAAAQRIAGGDFAPVERKPMATREFAELQDAFGQMLLRFNETRAALDAQMAEERGVRQELQSLQRQVIRQERLAAVGQLVSGVAHEINNPLQAILGFAELLQMQGDVPEAVKGDLRLIQKESARACGIIRNLALFARQQTGQAAPVRLTDVVVSVVELRQRRLETESIELRLEDHSRQPVLAVLAELQQVVLNFVVNAEQAIVMSKRQPGRITVRTRDEGNRVVLEVEDTGPGVPPEHEPKLFQPFFTTKPVGQGTGLGLSVSYGIIDSLGGRIGYRSAPAGGAVFYVDLPAAPA